MATGYTEGILDGTINTFPEFAKICMRAMGATIMMRDEPLNAPYQPRIPSDFHIKKIDEAQKVLDSNDSDEVLIESAKKELEKSKKYHIEAIEKAKVDRKKLEFLLKQANEYTPPTNEHKGVKDFMIQQISETITWDATPDYHETRLAEIETELATMTPKSIRQKQIERSNYYLNYHIKEHEKEIKRCEDSNKWVDKFLESLK